VKIHAGTMLGYPVGGGPGTGSLALLCIVTAFVILARRKRWELFLLALAPMVLHLVAAALQRYPYGVHTKFTFYLAPLYSLLIGLGAAAILAWLGRVRGRATVFLFALLGVYALVGVGSIARDLWHPYKTWSDMRARAFARWFWFDAEREGEVVCLHSDLKLSFSKDETTKLSWLYTYLCNQRIYSPRHARGEPPRLDRSPLRFVRYRVGWSDRFTYDEEAFQAWLEEQKRRYRFVGKVTFPFARFAKGGRVLWVVDHLDVYTFKPK
jgi:hypothetical protein